MQFIWICFPSAENWWGLMFQLKPSSLTHSLVLFGVSSTCAEVFSNLHSLAHFQQITSCLSLISFQCRFILGHKHTKMFSSNTKTIQAQKNIYRFTSIPSLPVTYCWFLLVCCTNQPVLRVFCNLEWFSFFSFFCLVAKTLISKNLKWELDWGKLEKSRGFLQQI